MTLLAGADRAVTQHIAMLPPNVGLEREMALLQQVADGQIGWGRLAWVTEQCLVVPRIMTRLAGFFDARAVMAAEGWPVHVRDTGGDVYPLGDGIVALAVAFRLPNGEYDRIGRAYAELCDLIVDAAADCGLAVHCAPVLGALCAGSHDLAIGGRKFAGVAQRWRAAASVAGLSHATLVHAGLLCVGDVSLQVSAVNRFYRYCGLDRHANVDSHRSLFHGLDNARGWSMTVRLVECIVERLDHRTDGTPVRSADGVNLPRDRPVPLGAG